MEFIYVGIDVAKASFDACVLDSNHQILERHDQCLNHRKGIEAFLKKLEQYGLENLWVCLEHTGAYGDLLCSVFYEKKVRFSLVNPLEIKRSSGITRGKTDRIDAYRIASYAATFQRKLKVFQPPKEAIQELKNLISQRDFYVKQGVQLKNFLKLQEVKAESADMRGAIKTAKKQITSIQKVIDELSRAILATLKTDEELNKTYKKITQVIGVGPITAVKTIVATNNFTSFISARKFACHCGLAPFDYQSGTSVKRKSRTSKMSDKSLKAIFFGAANTAIYHDPQLKAYFTRKMKEGKHKLSVKNAVANKIILRIFAVALRETPFVRFAA